METNDMTPEKSLQLISEAISKSRRDFEKNSGTPMIIWGITVLVFSLIIWLVLRSTENPMWNLLWFAVPAFGWPATRILTKDKKVNGAKNFINGTIGQVWIGYGIFAVATALILVFTMPQLTAPVNIAMLGYGTFMTGMLLKNRYIMAGGIITGIGGVAALAILKTYDATLIFTMASLTSLIIPGMMMNRNNKYTSVPLRDC